MDNNIFDQNVSEGINLTPLAENYLKETAKWGKFISIVGFVMVGLFVLIAIFSNAIFSLLMSMGGTNTGGGGGVLTFAYLIYAVIYFFPVFYLFKFSTKASAALQARDSVGVEESLENLKSLYKYLGILTIISLALTALAFLGTIAGLSSLL